MEVPFDLDGVTPDWLTATLRERGVLPGGRVTALTVYPVGGKKGIAGKLSRLVLDFDEVAPGVPRSIIAKFSAPDPQMRALQHASGIYEREVRFYEGLASRSPLRTPRLYFSAFDPRSGQSTLLLEDLSEFRNGNWVAGCSVAEARLALGALASLHAAWWMSPQLTEYPWIDLRGQLAVDEVPRVFPRIWEAFLERLGPRVSDGVRDAGTFITSHLGWIYPRLYREPPCTLVHNDFSADNLFFVNTGSQPSVAVADWQLVTRGRGLLDVAYFLGGSMKSEERRVHEKLLLEEYHSALCTGGVRDYPFEDCWNDYRLAAVAVAWRVIGVVGLGVVPPDQEGGFNDVLIPRYCQTVRDLVTSDFLAGQGPGARPNRI